MADSWDDFPDTASVATAPDNATPATEWGQFPDAQPEQLAPGAILGRMTQKMLEAPPDSQLSQARRLPNRILYAVNRWPVMGKVLGLTYDAAVMRAANKIRDDKAGPNDYVMVANHLASAKERGDQSTLQTIVDAVGHLPGFGVEFALTGGAFSGARQAATTALGNAAKSLAGKAAAAAVGVAAQAAANPQLVGQQAVQRMMPPMQMQTAPTGEVANVNIGQDSSLASSLPPAFLDTMIELGSERTGTYLVKGLGALGAKLSPFQRGIVSTWLSKPGRTLTTAEQVLKSGGFDGMLGEILEERLGEAARIATGLQSPGDTVLGQAVTAPAQAAKQLAIEAATFAVPGAAGAASHLLPQQTQADPALQSKLDSIQSQYVKDTAERKDTAQWLKDQALQRDISQSESAYRQMEADQRQQRQETDKSALDKYFRENMPQDVQPDTSVGGIRQLPLSPDVDLNAPPSQEQPSPVDLGQFPERQPTPQPIDSTLPVEQPQSPGMRLTNQWQPLPADAPTPTASGADVYQASDGTRYIRASDGGPTLQSQMQQRAAELAGMNIGQLNQEGSRYGLESGMNKGAKIQQILTAEEQRALSAPSRQQPSGQMIEPLQGNERQPVMLGLPNPISELYDPRAPKSLVRKTLTDPVSQTQQEMQDAAGQVGQQTVSQPQYQSGKGRRKTAKASSGDSPVGAEAIAGQEAAVSEEAPVTYKMLDFDSRGRLKNRTELPADKANRLLKGREVVFQKLLECLS